MKNIILGLLLLTTSSFAGKLQGADFKSSAELATAGATDAAMLNDTKFYITAGSLNKQLFTALGDGSLFKFISPLTTKGDLIGYSTTPGRLPGGTNNDVLTYDSTQTFGFKWAAPASSGQAALQFKDEGSNLGTSGTATSIDCTGTGVTCSRASDAITINVAGGGSSGGPPYTNVQAFTSAGRSTFTVPGGVTELGVVVVGAGGAGGSGSGVGRAGGGGGAGAINFDYKYSVVPGTVIQLFVGDGGLGNPGGAAGDPGGNSHFGRLIAQGGSGAAGSDAAGTSRGNGGGGSGGNPTASGISFDLSNLTGVGSSVFYALGGTGAGTATSTELGGGGGGDGSTNGANAVAGTNAGAGGAGLTITMQTGVPLTYGGGGGGGSYGGAKPAGAGGSGGGGGGGLTAVGTAGTVNTGGGGGGGGGNNNGGAGGRGVVRVYWN